MNRLTRPLLIGALAAFVFLAPASVAYALWSTTATGTLTVSTGSPLPNPPVLSCDPGRQNNNDFTMSWNPVGGADTYVVTSGTSNTDAGYSNQATGPGSSYTHATTSGSSYTRYFRVTAFNGGTPSAVSNTIMVKRTGNGSNNYQCEKVTP
jgi:hypothetical protein